MTRIEKLKNDILIGMRIYLDANTMTILESVIVQAVSRIDIVELDTAQHYISTDENQIYDTFRHYVVAV